MGYWPKRMKRRRGSWVYHVGLKLILMGAEGSHSESWGVYAHGATRYSGWKRVKHYFIEVPVADSMDGIVAADGNSPEACLIRMARYLEIV